MSDQDERVVITTTWSLVSKTSERSRRQG